MSRIVKESGSHLKSQAASKCIDSFKISMIPLPMESNAVGLMEGDSSNSFSVRGKFLKGVESRDLVLAQF